jgi:para-nitrobenzyl esterase
MSILISLLLLFTTPTTSLSTPTITDPTLGIFHGIHVNSTSSASSQAFLGLPFAIPPVGKLRFSPASLWTQKYPSNTTFDHFGDDCYQGGTPPDPSHVPQSEDCLTINVWRPNKTSFASSAATNITNSGLSVLVWIYGGGFQGGSSAVRWWNGAALAANENIIVVSMNYRVGALGFLASDEISSEYGMGTGGLNGIYDQIVALQWVQNHIASFGGDPTSVTLFGQSAGGESVCVLCLSPPANKLFKRAIVQSGPCAYSYWKPENKSFALELGKSVLKNNNVTTVAELRDLPVSDVAWPDGPSESPYFNGYFAPDGYVLPKTPAEMLMDSNNVINPVDILIGTTSMDGTLTFVYPSLKVPIHWWQYQHRMKVLYSDPGVLPSANDPRAEAVLQQYPLSRFNSTTFNGASYGYVRSDADRALVCPTKKLARSFAKMYNNHHNSSGGGGGGGNVYHYVFEYGTMISKCDIVHTMNPIAPRDEALHWASHGTENRILFGTEYGPDISPTPRTIHCDFEDDRALSKEMQNMWATFAKTGKPSMEWPTVPAVDDESIGTMRIDNNSSIEVGYRKSDCAFWEKWNVNEELVVSLRIN